MRNRLIGAAAVAAASAVVLSGCSGGDAGSTDGIDFEAAPTGTLAAWGFENADDVGTARLDYAAEQLSDVEVELDATAFDSQKFTTRIASGDVPDVVQMDRRYVTQYAAQDLIMPLDACFEAQGVDPEERWYESVVEDVTFDDEVWGAPQFYQPPAIILNKTVMNEAGVRADEIDTSQPDVLIAAIEKMYQESGGVPTRLGFDPVSTGQSALWILGSGGQLTDEDGVPTLDDPSNLAGMELLQRINDAQGGFAQVKSFTDAFDTFGDANQFVTNQVGAQVNAQWYPNVLSPYVDQIDIEAVPFRDSEGEPFSVSGGQAFVIPMNAKNPAAACAWVSELTSGEAWNAAGEARAETRTAEGGVNTGLFTGSPQPDQEIREKWVVPSGDAGFDQVVATYYDVVDYGTSFGSSPAGQDIQNELNNAVTAALLGDKTAEEALADAQDAAMRAYENATAAR
ncbi:ABC transporter substrate-binding protein [Microbacterium imperiale]|uniref:Sugar ABC transporter substrate-binding protein n=1 Tax=Microbacterium imperiale TaxID=33884 RepID=A0A9W6M3S6_9MICO|nr:extracellular solute-binding protein [Microbacterium imperiale]MBP2421123.1 multiple sugar transport system substrate-binding protein [Microbacterium imperiale]MDS0199765.1 extracellular solute-binding protein [Microbacterium imperiale]BFE41464.1 extracellular solute-binding protein [Microbacterium imperiale]GLJ80415.1 sugar ABC transporter substrate-binding protein [Microbacterium imperiale]